MLFQKKFKKTIGISMAILMMLSSYSVSLADDVVKENDTKSEVVVTETNSKEIEPKTNIIEVNRDSGVDRYSTSINIAKKHFDRFDSVLLDSGEDFADALYAGPLASTLKSPLILTRKNSISEDAFNLFKEKGVKKVYLIGGQNSVSPNVEKEIKDRGLEVERISGKDRFDTAVAVSDRIYKGKDLNKYYPPNVLYMGVTSGRKFADALSASPYSYYRQQKEWFYLLPFDGYHLEGIDVVFGGENSVPRTFLFDGVENTIGNKVFAGVDRYDTSVQIAEASKSLLPNGIKSVVIASGETYADALSTAPVATRYDGVILLTNKNKLNEKVKKFIKDNIGSISYIEIAGGENTLSANVENEIKNLVKNPTE